MRLEVTEKEKGEVTLPRAVRLARKYKLSENEMMLFNYVLVDQVGLYLENVQKRTFGSFGGMGGDLASTCNTLDLSLLEMLGFLSSERQHMQHGLFPDINQTYILSNAIRFDSEIMKALVGGKLSSSDFLKVENTPLGDILAEEPGSEHYTKGLLEPMGTCVLKRYYAHKHMQLLPHTMHLLLHTRTHKSCIHSCTHICTHADTRTHMHTQTCTHTHIHTCTHTE